MEPSKPQRKVCNVAPSRPPSSHQANEHITQACDLCCESQPLHSHILPIRTNHPPDRKKLKCDAQKPRCSSCILYNSECTHKAASRKKGAAAKQATARRDAEFQNLEEQLQEALRKVERLEKTSNEVHPVRRDDVEALKKRPHRNLPPYPDAVALVEEYLSTFNTVFPLFDPETILQTLRTWYTSQNPNPNNDPVTYALINVILALAHHTNPKPPGSATTHLNNAQSVLSSVISSPSITLINVQIPLGLALLFWFVNDIPPAMILVATALRLAHTIGLQRRGSAPPRERVQRTRVFWMAYILDRDTSMAARVAPIQGDWEVDVEVPPLTLTENGDSAGFIFSSRGDCSMNFFRARVQLARIQGKVYEYVYSLSAQNTYPQERARNISRVLQALDDWGEEIPLTFRSWALANIPSAEISRYFVILYGVRLGCRALISHASSADSFHVSKWVEDVREYGESTAAGVRLSRNAPVSNGWPTLVCESRDYMNLFESVALKDDFLVS